MLAINSTFNFVCLCVLSFLRVCGHRCKTNSVQKEQGLLTIQSPVKTQLDELINKRCTRPLDYSDSINMCIISTFFYSIFFILSAKSQSFPSYLEDYQEISCTSYLSCGYKTHAQL